MNEHHEEYVKFAERIRNSSDLNAYIELCQEGLKAHILCVYGDIYSSPNENDAYKTLGKTILCVALSKLYTGLNNVIVNTKGELE